MFTFRHLGPPLNNNSIPHIIRAARARVTARTVPDTITWASAARALSAVGRAQKETHARCSLQTTRAHRQYGACININRRTHFGTFRIIVLRAHINFNDVPLKNANKFTSHHPPTRPQRWVQPFSHRVRCFRWWEVRGGFLHTLTHTLTHKHFFNALFLCARADGTQTTQLRGKLLGESNARLSAHAQRKRWPDALSVKLMIRSLCVRVCV